ncbi:MAG: hypothetical protein IT530_06035 [Burkholderiales bacterium]|nr:hypothetical protein [Burkholderiales bacterium]
MRIDRNPGVEPALSPRRTGVAHYRAAVLGFMLACWLLAPAYARAQTIVGAEYEAPDALVVEIAYRGTSPDHEFTLSWDPCRAAGNGAYTVVARLIDRQGKDRALNDYQVRRRFDLSGLECRPAELTIRLGPVSNRTVSVPARGH